MTSVLALFADVEHPGPGPACKGSISEIRL
jgi:hypothetical protein